MKLKFQFSTLFMIVVSVLMVLTSCKKEEEKEYKETRKQGTFKFLDVANARTLAITGAGGAAKMASNQSSGGNALFKITDEGIFQEIKFYRIDTIYTETPDGMVMKIDSTEVTDKIYPVHLFNVPPDYLIACFDEANPEGGAPFEHNFLVRKSDGAVFNLPWGRPVSAEHQWGYGKMFKNEDGYQIIQTDEQGNIYFLGGWVIHMINTINPQNLTYQQITTATINGEGAANFRVNGAGHLIFTSGGITTPFNVRFRYNTGALAYPEHSIIPYWLGLDNNFYYSRSQNNYPTVGRITLENNQANYEPIGTFNLPQLEYASLKNGFIFKMKSLNKIIVIAEPYFMPGWVENGPIVTEVYNNDMAVKGFNLNELGIASINMGGRSNNYIYLSGMWNNQPVLVKIDPSGYPHSASYLVPIGELDIFKMAVSNDDIVTFHALRMSNGKTIIGQILPSGEIIELEEFGNQIYQLIQVQ